MEEWMNKMWFTHIIGYYPVIKRNEALTQATRWDELWSYCAKVKEAGHKKVIIILYDAMYMKCPE